MKKDIYLPRISRMIDYFSRRLNYLYFKNKSFKKRRAFSECWNILFKNSIRQFILLEGLRRTGKTTLLNQIYWEILNKNKATINDLIYLKLDSPFLSGYKSTDYIQFFDQIIDKNRKIYLFLDEIQSLEEWDKFLKEIFDSFPNILIIASGSSSLKINMEETGGTRWKKIKLGPLSFSEFIELKYSKTDLIKHINYQNLPKINELWAMEKEQLNELQKNADNLRPFFNEYIFQGSYPETTVNKTTIDYYQRFVYEKIYMETVKDILFFTSKMKKTKIKFNSFVFGILFNKLIYQTGSEFSLRNFSIKHDVNIPTLNEHLEVFIKANLFRKCVRISPSEKKLMNVSAKYYLTDHTFYPAYYRCQNVDELKEKKGHLYENLVFNCLNNVAMAKQIGFYKYSETEIDFTFFLTPEKKYLIECKSKNIDMTDIEKKLNDKSVGKNLQKICVNENKLIVKENVLYIPIALFLLLEF